MKKIFQILSNILSRTKETVLVGGAQLAIYNINNQRARSYSSLERSLKSFGQSSGMLFFSNPTISSDFAPFANLDDEKDDIIINSMNP